MDLKYIVYDKDNAAGLLLESERVKVYILSFVHILDIYTDVQVPSVRMYIFLALHLCSECQSIVPSA